MRRVHRLRIPSILVVASLCSGGAAGGVAGDGALRDGAEPAAFRSEVVVLGARAVFATNSDTLLPDGEAALRRLARDRLIERIDPDSIVAIRVVGHSDSVGAAAYNLLLSERRAAAVAAVLARAYPGVPITTEGRGESAPIADNATAAGRARNRRVEMHVVSVDERR